MVAKTDCGEKPKSIAGKKVSKPLMEKKRRARINKCLDQLKSLLESYYSTSIRKRKLEKADILELTVNHLRNLQKVQSCSVAASEFSDYQNGFRRCMANVDRYLLMADNLNGSDCWMLSQLPSKLWRSRGREKEFSTTESGPSRGEPQAGERRLEPAAPEERKTGESKALETRNASTSGYSPSEDARQLSRNKQVVTETAQNTHDESEKRSQSVSHANEGANTAHMWRPW